MLGYCGNEQFENHKADDEKIFKKTIQSYRLADHNGSIVYEIEFPNLVTYEYASVGVFATVDNFMKYLLILIIIVPLPKLMYFIEPFKYLYQIILPNFYIIIEHSLPY